MKLLSRPFKMSKMGFKLLVNGKQFPPIRTTYRPLDQSESRIFFLMTLYLEACHFNYYFVIKIILVTRPETDDVNFMSREEISIV